jgi:NitT/TauT family transport system substrate-binding protein
VPEFVTNSYFPAFAAEELGYYAAEGIEAHVELLAPAPRAITPLRDGEVDVVAAGAHTPLTVFPQWQGAKLVVTLAQGTPWLLVMRADIPTPRGDLQAVKGFYIGAVPRRDAALRHLLTNAGLDLARDDIHIGPVPGHPPPAHPLV